MSTATDSELAGSGITGLDQILGGGFPKHNIYLIQGDPGAGKTTLSLQFLLEGARNGESGLYVTLSESQRELHTVAMSHGWSLEPIQIYEQLVGEERLREDDTTLYHPAEVELSETISTFLGEIERTKPQRVVLDSLSEIRLLSQNVLRYRKQILALKQFFAQRKITALFLDDRTSEDNDLQLHSVPYGVVVLERRAPVYGAPRRRLEVVKLRGVDFRGGFHDFSIVTGGIVVYPRLVAAEHKADFQQEQISSDIPQVDAMLGGGLHRGTSTLFLGPAGSGKSALATKYAVAAAGRGERVAMFIFDESRSTLLSRSEGLGMPLRALADGPHLSIQQIDPAELAPGAFAHLVRNVVEDEGARVVVIDSLNGFLNAMPEERFLTLHLHELLSYLGQHGVVTILVMAQHGMLGSGMISTADVSYLADSVVLLRYYEAEGEIRKAVSVLKKRSGPHEKSIRDFDMRPGGIHVGDPLRQFRGIMTGVPVVANGSGDDSE